VGGLKGGWKSWGVGQVLQQGWRASRCGPTAPAAACRADHTTLLLNCYTKLKNVDKLDAFVHKEHASNEGKAAPNFDLETAYKVGAGLILHRAGGR
jgi:hypothetical protein